MTEVDRHMSTPQILSTPAVAACADLLDDGIGRLLKRRDSITQFGKYESDSEAMLQMFIVVRHVESVVALARTDLCLLPSAMVLARACLETAIVTQWLMMPTDPFEREIRWLTLLDKAEDTYRRLVKRLTDRGADASWLEPTWKELKLFNAELRRRFPTGYQQVGKLPKVDQIFDQVRCGGRYEQYIVGSQFTHPSLIATEFYRRGIGDDKTTGEFIEPKNWVTPFSICWYAITEPWVPYLSRTGGNGSGFPGPGVTRRMQRALTELATSKT